MDKGEGEQRKGKPSKDSEHLDFREQVRSDMITDHEREGAKFQIFNLTFFHNFNPLILLGVSLRDRAGIWQPLEDSRARLSRE